MPTVVVGAAVAFAASNVVSVGVALAIGAASAIAFDALMDSMVPDAGGVSTGSQDLRTESNPNRLMIVGEAVTSGPITKYEKRTFNQKEYHLFFTPLAAHPCESVELYQLDGKSRTSLSGSGYRIEVALGLQTTANQSAMTEMVNIDDTFIGYGVTYAYHKYEVNPDIFPNGVQDVKFKVRGLRCYDPRLDSTAGGIGAHRADDESTWEWTDNAALINFYWKRFGGAIVLPIEMFDLANIALEANLCDEEVTFIDKNGVTHTEKRWTCNGVIDLSKGQASVEEELLRSCGARWAEAGGKFWLITAAYRGPATVTLTDDDLKDDIERDPYTPLEDRCNAVVATFIDPESYYQQTNCTEIYSEYYRDVRDKRYLQHARELGYTNSDTMCQRLNRIYMERAAAGDTLRVVVGWKGIKCPPGKVINVNFNEHSIINKEYEVLEYEFDSEQFLWTLILKETTSAIFDDTVIPSERDLTPNTDIDNTQVSAPENISYLPTPNDAWRQGVISWEHDTPDSVRRYVVLITKLPADDFSKVYYPTQATVDISNLELGDYTVAISAQNRFDKSSVATSANFNVGVTSTPTENIGVNILPGRVVVTGPTPPNNAATYEWRYSFEGSEQEHFDSAIDGGRNLTLVITNTPHNGIVTVWYRLVNGASSDPNWLSVTIPNLVGIDAQEFVPETFALVQWSGLPNNLGDTIDSISNDIQNWSQQSSQLGTDYSTLIYNVTQVAAANQANQLQILGISEKVGDSSVSAQIAEFKNAQIGYTDENGEWIEGAAFAQAFEEVKVTNLEGEEVSVIAYMQALENAVGGLEATYYLGVIDENEQFTGLSILGGNNNSSIHLYMDNLKFASQAGVVFFNLSTVTGKLEIGANTEFTGTLRAAREVTVTANVMEVKDPDGFGPDNLWIWKGAPILDSNNEPDYLALTKQNASLGWRDLNGNEYFGGSVTTGQLINGGDSTLISLEPSLPVGPFTTNGNPKQVSYSVYWRGRSTIDGYCPTNNFTPSCTLILERSIDGGGWSQLQSHAVTGEITMTELFEPELSQDPSGRLCNVVETTQAAFTYTDADASLGTFSYRLKVLNQFRYHQIQFIDRQNISLISVEERPS